MSDVVGIERLYRVADRLPGLVDKTLSDELRDGLTKPIPQFRQEVRSRIDADMPHRYAGVFGSSFRINAFTSATGGGVRINLVGSARGRAKKRDSAALNRGVLRHKTYGHLPWHSQAIRAGFWDEPARDLVNKMRDELEAVVERAAEKIEAEL